MQCYLTIHLCVRDVLGCLKILECFLLLLILFYHPQCKHAAPGDLVLHCISDAQVQLSNGLKVFLIEDHEVPLVKVTLAVRGGQRASPSNKVCFWHL